MTSLLRGKKKMNSGIEFSIHFLQRRLLNQYMKLDKSAITVA